MNYRRTLIRIVTFLGGLYFFLEFVLPGEIYGIKTAGYDENISNGFITVSAMALGLGIFNILAVHGSKIVFRRKGYWNSIALLVGLALMLVVTAFDWRAELAASADANRLFVLRDFADRIRADAEQKVATVMPVAERNKKLTEALAPLLEEIDVSTRATALPPDALQTDRDLFASLKSDSAQSLAAARRGAESLTSTLAEATVLDADTALAKTLGALGSTRLELLNLAAKYSLEKKTYEFLYTGLFTSLGAAMFSLLGFYIASAAYRAFRVRSAESGLMMMAALLVMLGQIPFGKWISDALPSFTIHGTLISLDFTAIRFWLLKYPSAAAFRAIKIGAGVATLVMAFRMWFSIESEEFTQKDEA